MDESCEIAVSRPLLWHRRDKEDTSTELSCLFLCKRTTRLFEILVSPYVDAQLSRAAVTARRGRLAVAVTLPVQKHGQRIHLFTNTSLCTKVGGKKHVFSSLALALSLVDWLCGKVWPFMFVCNLS